MNVKLLACESMLQKTLFKKRGLSILIDNSIMFDAFSNYNGLRKRIRKHNVDINKLKTIVISHEHKNNIKCLFQLLKDRPNLNVYLPTNATEKIKKEVINLGGILKEEKGARTIKPKIHITENIIGAHKGKPISEHAMALETNNGIILLSSCAHSGIGAFILKARQNFKKPIYGIIGGLHLLGNSNSELMNEALSIKQEGVSMIVPVNNIKRKTKSVFKSIFREDYIDLKEGEELMFV